MGYLWLLHRKAKPTLHRVAAHHILYLGLLNKANLSSLAEPISKEEEMEVLINIIKPCKD